ncbi:TlpA family protein disulfide reductase [Pedobacter duraquae]|uniref:Thiol-disulfide isomerase/thioredoxin n=1 Tax=Pedobacter duraquae TaxID=425511 RepID=A0A4R6IAW2_9SPHI|nr:TlpA disulfide reductase family protein [Pedobacter duraquae]TDO19340.1 thiol-disulfide isomerase/thioredoxin [Pedobacter duraquae]
MKKIVLLLSFIAVLSISSYQLKAQENSPSLTLSKMAAKLSELNAISYQYRSEVNNIKNDYHSAVQGDVYVEFDSTNKSLVARFQLETEKYRSIYNGAEIFTLDKKLKTYRFTEQPDPGSFGSLSFFHNAIQTLANQLPSIVSSNKTAKDLADTLINKKTYKVITLSLFRSSLQYAGQGMKFTKDVTINYRILINPETYLPYQVIETNDIDKALYNTITTFTEVNTNPRQPETKSWYYSSYQNAYTLEKKADVPLLIPVGSILTDWALPEFDGKSNPILKSDQLTGKVILMDFWIKNCGPCMESFPYLKELQAKYGKDKFQLLAINAYDKKEEVAFFYNREQPNYKMLYTGKALAKQAGVSGYPTVVLLDKSGKVIYTGEFDHVKIEAMIKAHI